MAADPSIYDTAKLAPTPDPVKQAASIANIADVASQTAERNATTADVRAQAQQRIQTAQDQAAANVALQSTNGDYRAAAKLVYPTNARAGQLLDTAADAKEKAAQSNLEASLKNTQTQLTMGTQLANIVGDPSDPASAARYVSALPALRASLPSSMSDQAKAALLPDQLDPQGAALMNFQQALVTGQDHVTNAQNALKLLTDGKPREAFLTDLQGAGDDPAARQAIKARWAQMPGVTPAMLSEADGVPAAKIGDLLTTAAEKATIANNQQARDQAAATLAETTRRDTALIRHEANQDADAKQRLNLSAGTGADPELVAAWTRQLRNPTSGFTITQVPKELKNAVALALGPGDTTKLTAQAQNSKESATTLLPFIDRVQALATQIDKMGLTGTVGGRLRSLLNGESAATDISGLTKAQQQLVGQFVTEAGYLKSGINKMHMGARGAGSPQMDAVTGPLLDPGDKGLDVYIGNLNGARELMRGYAAAGEAAPTTGTAKDPLGIR